MRNIEVVLLFFAVLLISDVFCYHPELVKRKWQPLNWFEPLISCKTGEYPPKSLKSYGCYCGTAIDRQFRKQPVDALDKCCQDHKKCLEEYTTEGKDSFCSSVHLYSCEEMAILCIKKLYVNAILTKKKRICQ
ncbi:acidic phospholipase A2 KBf-grIB-like [Oculina patagonica]